MECCELVNPLETVGPLYVDFIKLNDGMFFAFRNNCNIRARPFELSIFVNKKIILLLGLDNGISKQTLAIFHNNLKKLSNDIDDVGLERGLGDLTFVSEI